MPVSADLSLMTGHATPPPPHPFLHTVGGRRGCQSAPPLIDVNPPKSKGFILYLFASAKAEGAG